MWLLESHLTITCLVYKMKTFKLNNYCVCWFQLTLHIMSRLTFMVQVMITRCPLSNNHQEIKRKIWLITYKTRKLYRIHRTTQGGLRERARESLLAWGYTFIRVEFYINSFNLFTINKLKSIRGTREVPQWTEVHALHAGGLSMIPGTTKFLEQFWEQTPTNELWGTPEFK